MIAPLILSLFCLVGPELDTIQSSVAKPGDYEYAVTLAELHEGEKWGWHSDKIGAGKSSSNLVPQGKNSYEVSNLYDLDLRTAWIEGEKGYGIGSKIFFTLTEEYPTSCKDFNGQIEVFNGYCKSEETWKANSRVRKLKLYINSEPLCYIELQDTWQYQTVDLSHLISGYDTSPHKLVEGDILTFEIVSVYPGEKYDDVGLSELVTPSYGGG